jgi:two-component system sensor histidine kinase DesK
MARPLLSGFFRPAPFDAGEDPDAAPSAYCGPDAVRPWTLRRGPQNLLWVYVFGILFLVLAIPGFTAGAASAWVAAGRGVAVGLIAGGYLLAPWMADTSLVVRRTYVFGFAGVLVASSAAWGWTFVNYGVYAAVLFATLIPWRTSRSAILVWSGLLLVAAWISGTWGGVYTSLISVAVALPAAAGMENSRVTRQLRRADQRVSILAVAAERERIGRDLHDILGHSLTAISIKSSLAAKLIRPDPKQAEAQIREVEGIARQALADVRATASGLAEVRVASEIASARSVLLAAGIEADTPTATEPLSDELSELFGYVVREGVTNVVRHAGATRCTIRLRSEEVSVADDGSGEADQRARGHGLAGLSSRLARAGGTLEVDATPGVGTVVRARVGARRSATTTDGVGARR